VGGKTSRHYKDFIDLKPLFSGVPMAMGKISINGPGEVNFS
jgi:hypothetical protein